MEGQGGQCERERSCEWQRQGLNLQPGAADRARIRHIRVWARVPVVVFDVKLTFCAYNQSDDHFVCVVKVELKGVT
uniref:Uncharacterized protein n=1 Tax=Oryza sativa subsp. japonica TaxID=39947 RepID=Q6ZLJ7_ORYSJ|nr:hypothetical protein [Oryza sativa Japonica Group]